MQPNCAKCENLRGLYAIILHFCIMELQIKEVARKKKVTITNLAVKMGVPRRTLYYWIEQSITFQDLNRVANALQCNIVELIKPSDGFMHWYNDDGIYKGMLKA